MRNRKGTYILIRVYILCAIFSSLKLQSQELEYYLEIAIKNNPNIQVATLKHEVVKEKVNEVNWIPNTQFNAGYFISEPETRTGAQRAKFSLKQMLPWFGTISARENYVNSIADTEYLDIAIAKRKLILSVSKSYYKLYSLKEKQKVLTENMQLVKTFENLAFTYLEVGKASAVDLLRLQIRQNELQQEKEVIEEEYRGEQIAFNKLLNSSKIIVITIPEKQLLLSNNLIHPNANLALNPELIKLDKRYQSITHSELLNKMDAKPKIGFGLDYIPVSQRPDLFFGDNGKDIFMPTVSASIPIFSKKNNSISKQNELKQLEITAQKKNVFNVLESDLAQAISKQNQARVIYKSQNKSIKQANDAEEILLKSYETGIIDFNDVLDIQELKLKLQTNRISAIQTYYEQDIVINYLISNY